MGDFLTIPVKSHFKHNKNRKSDKFYLTSKNQTYLLCYKLMEENHQAMHSKWIRTYKLEHSGILICFFDIKIDAVEKMLQKVSFTEFFGVIFFVCSIFGWLFVFKLSLNPDKI
jgi:hypothetical protein